MATGAKTVWDLRPGDSIQVTKSVAEVTLCGDNVHVTWDDGTKQTFNKTDALPDVTDAG